MGSTGILIVDPCNLFRAGLRHILPSDFRIEAEAADTAEALRILDTGATRERLELILLEVAEDQDPKDKIQKLKAALPEARVIHLTTNLTPGRLQAVFEAGGDGCLSKDRSADALGQAMRLVIMGEKVFPSEVMSLLRQVDRSGGSGTRPNGLSARESQILSSLLEGESNKAIANVLRISEATVKVHLKSLMRKLNVTNRTQAAIWAMNHGMISDRNSLARKVPGSTIRLAAGE